MAVVKITEKRSSQGAALPLISIFILVIAMIGVVLVWLMQVLGGTREAQNSTDAAGLNVARQALVQPAIKLTEGDEKDNFSRYQEADGTVNLRNYNRMVGQSLLVSLNAQAIGTAKARDNARSLYKLVLNDGTSIGGRLTTKLKESDAMAQAFEQLAVRNATRMLQSSGRYDRKGYACAYLERGEASNVFVPAGSPASRLGAETLVRGQSGSTYIRGYQPITVGGGLTYTFVPLGPEQQPRLISQSQFKKAQSSTMAVTTPPNSFKTAMLTAPKVGGQSNGEVQSIACSVVGSLNQKYPLSIPGGFIKVINPPGKQNLGYVPPKDSIFSVELPMGINLGADDTGATRVFSLDENAMSALIAHNRDPLNFPSPASQDESGRDIFFNADGNVAQQRDLDAVTKQPRTSFCNDFNTASEPGNATCDSLIGAFINAYPHDNTQTPAPKTKITNVERYHANVLEEFNKWYQITRAAGRKSGGAVTIPTPQGYTGLRVFERDGGWSVHQALGEMANGFSHEGSLTELLRFVAHGADTALLSEVKERIRQINPEASEAEIARLLDSKKLALGTVHYIYADKSNQLIISETPPTDQAARVAADGKDTVFRHGPYVTLGRTVNPDTVGNEHHKFFNRQPAPQGTGNAIDEAIWTSSSGYKGLLGVLEFRNRFDLSQPQDGHFSSPN